MKRLQSGKIWEKKKSCNTLIGLVNKNNKRNMEIQAKPPIMVKLRTKMVGFRRIWDSGPCLNSCQY